MLPGRHGPGPGRVEQEEEEEEVVKVEGSPRSLPQGQEPLSVPLLRPDPAGSRRGRSADGAGGGAGYLSRSPGKSQSGGCRAGRWGREGARPGGQRPEPGSWLRRTPRGGKDPPAKPGGSRIRGGRPGAAGCG
ncbi:uncharacterized protein ACIB01_005415 [Guaruba guarouba]